MLIAEIEKRVEEIRACSGDAEAAHSLEDNLHISVLQDIADGADPNPSESAKAALKTLDIDFERWCA